MPFQGGKRPRAKLKYDVEVYTPIGAKSLSEHDIKKEYSRLRSIAEKRLKRFEGTEWEDTQVYKLNVGQYIPIEEIKSDYQLRHLFSDVARFVMAERGSVSGQKAVRKKAIETLHENGFDFVNNKNFKEFGEFMEYSRITHQNKLYDSKRIADFFNEQRIKKLSREELQKEFDTWAEEQKNFDAIQNENPRSSAQYRSKLNPLPKQSDKKKRGNK